jgi:peptide/nickel transport system permease protein
MRVPVRATQSVASVSLDGPRRADFVLRRVLRSYGGVLSFLALAIFSVVAMIGPWIAPYDPIAQDSNALLELPSSQHLLGTDQLGRDLLSRLIYGTRISLTAGFLVVGLAMSVGVPIGLLSGLLGGLVDDIVMRVMDAIVAFPGLILALAIVVMLGPGVQNVMIALGVTAVPVFARLVRAQTLSIGQMDYVAAARSVGASSFRVASRHVFPNVTAPIIVQGSLVMGGAILAEAGLSFLGVGIAPPTATWGLMVQQGLPFLRIDPWLSLVPGLAIFVLVLALNVFGDALRDALDPRMRDR